MGVFADFLGTLRTSFKVGKSSLSSVSLTADRTHTLPDISGTLALNSQYRPLLEAAIAEGSTTPNPGSGFVWAWSTSITKMMFWDGTRWRAASPGITVSTTAPANPAVNQLWVDTN